MSLFLDGYRGCEEIARSATISDCTLYRWELRRWWDESLPWALFWSLNPSTADASKDDPTIRRDIAFAKREGCGGFIKVNWFAWRATDPKQLPKELDIARGSECDWWIRHSIDLCKGPLIAAWGTHQLANQLSRDAGLMGSLLRGRPLHCLGTTKDGHPRHPLYVRADQPLVLWRDDSYSAYPRASLGLLKSRKWEGAK